jgi:hypothetical protein
MVIGAISEGRAQRNMRSMGLPSCWRNYIFPSVEAGLGFRTERYILPLPEAIATPSLSW